MIIYVISFKHTDLLSHYLSTIGPGPFPGVVDMFGGMGGTVEHRSALLASRGIASFALCYLSPEYEEVMPTDMEFYIERELLVLVEM